MSIFDNIVDALAGGDIYTVQASSASPLNDEEAMWTQGIYPESFTSATERAEHLNAFYSCPSALIRNHYEVTTWEEYE